LTGWNYETERSLSDTGFEPTHLEFGLTLDVKSGEADSRVMKRMNRRLPLFSEEKPIWFEHPIHGAKVDVAVVPLFETPDKDDLKTLEAQGLITIPANRHVEWTRFDIAAADDAYVVGFPKGMSTRGFPIWKRASIATEPSIDIDELPKLLVDTATREGMSGSPVIGMRRGIVMPNGKIDGETIIGEAQKLIGVYSGRIGEDELGVQLGIVWKIEVIDEILDARQVGSLPWNTMRA
jgi:hypothetical protein